MTTVNGARITRGSLDLPSHGAWVLRAHLDHATLDVGRANVTVGPLSLTGTILPTRSGEFVSERSVVVIGGESRMGDPIRARHYHNDAGIKLGLVVSEAIRDAGERLGAVTFPEGERIGVDYVRRADATAARVLAALGLAWRVEAGGAIAVGPLADSAPTGPYRVLGYSPTSRVVELDAEALGVLAPGAIIDVDGSKRVDGLRVSISASAMRLSAEVEDAS